MKKVAHGEPLRDIPVAAYVKLIRTAEAIHAEISRGLADYGLTASQFSTLKVLRLRGSQAQKDIATYLLKTGGNVTVVVDNLEKRGLARRDRSVEDRRLVMVSITPSGERLFDSIYPGHLERIKKAMAPLGEAGSTKLLELLEELYTTTGEPLCPSGDGEAQVAAS